MLSTEADVVRALERSVREQGTLTPVTSKAVIEKAIAIAAMDEREPSAKSGWPPWEFGW